jgi:hypothetical protein
VQPDQRHRCQGHFSARGVDPDPTASWRLGESTKRSSESNFDPDLAATWPGQQAWGWGATGHEWAIGIAIEKLPDEVPAFVRDPAVLPELALMGRELDRSKGAGETHDKKCNLRPRTFLSRDQPERRPRRLLAVHQANSYAYVGRDQAG